MKDKIVDSFYWLAAAFFDALFHWKLINPYDGPKPDMVGQYRKRNGLEPDPPFVNYLRTAVCSPVHRCFPPLPTICAFCGHESGTDCPLKELDDSTSGLTPTEVHVDELHQRRITVDDINRTFLQ